MERPATGSALFRRSCGCNSSNSSDLPIIYTSSSPYVEVHFTATNMTALDDPEHLNFEATYEFIKLPVVCKEVSRLVGTSGTVELGVDTVRTQCDTITFVI